MPQAAQHERRQHPRQNASFSIEIQMETQASSQHVELRDISEGGMSFIVDTLEPYRTGQRLQISIPQYNAQGLLELQHLQGKIVWLQEQDLLNPRAWVGLRLLADI